LEVLAELGVDFGDVAHRIADAAADRFSGSLDTGSEQAGPPAESGGCREREEDL
jgi:hypothetical protein